MNTFTKGIFALAMIAATPALADDNNNPAPVFERNAAQYQALQPSRSAAVSDVANATTYTNFDKAYRADSGR